MAASRERHVIRNDERAPGMGVPGITVWCAVACAVVAGHAAAWPADGDSLRGIVVEVRSGAPVVAAEVRIESLRRGAITDDAGGFVLMGLPTGSHLLRIQRAGYHALNRTVVVPLAADSELRIELEAAPVSVSGVRVRSTASAGAGSDTALALTGVRMREALGATIAETLDEEPGIAQRTMGPAPARPVLRGLGGNRLLMLSDGERTGDLSATSADHAVAIEAMAAQEIEVIRGPAALLYGSNTLGGVVNVETGLIPDALPARAGATLTAQSESMNLGRSGSLQWTQPVGRVAVRASLTRRDAGDMRTPVGTLGNTAIATSDASAGARWIGSHVQIGAGGGSYRSRYGIPGGFLGGHPDGVDLEVERDHLEGEVRIQREQGLLRALELSGRVSEYYHRELESGGACGISFGVLQYNATVRAQLGRAGDPAHATVGMWTEYRDWANGCLSFAPRSVERTLAGFGYGERAVGSFRMRAAARGDLKAVIPERELVNSAGRVRGRSFAGLAGAAALVWVPSERWTQALNVTRTFNPPGIEELFSDGPHLASYAYEVGNADLGAEHGTGYELVSAIQGGPGRLEFSFFLNDISNYIYARDTGELDYGSGEDGVLALYQYAGADARLPGAELSGHWDLTPSWSLDANVSAVRGTLRDSGIPLPFIPAVGGKGELRWSRSSMSLAGRCHFAAAQRRLGEFEDPTAAFAVFDLSARWNGVWGHTAHNVILSVENLADAEYRKHLSRVKSVMPEAGRSLKVYYRVRL